MLRENYTLAELLNLFEARVVRDIKHKWFRLLTAAPDILDELHNEEAC